LIRFLLIVFVFRLRNQIITNRLMSQQPFCASFNQPIHQFATPPIHANRSPICGKADNIRNGWGKPAIIPARKLKESL
jgi:hypothetical protein